MDWNKYKETFPDRYMQKSRIDEEINDANVWRMNRSLRILDIGGGKDGTFNKNRANDKFYLLDPNITVAPDGYQLISWNELKDEKFDLIVARGSLNYLIPDELKEIKNHIKPSGMFIGNSFLLPTAINREYTINGIPTGIEKTIYEEVKLVFKPEWKGIIHHELIPFEGEKITHQFYYYDIYKFISFFKPNNITLEVYGHNSVIIKCTG